MVTLLLGKGCADSQALSLGNALGRLQGVPPSRGQLSCRLSFKFVCSCEGNFCEWGQWDSVALLGCRFLAMAPAALTVTSFRLILCTPETSDPSPPRNTERSWLVAARRHRFKSHCFMKALGKGAVACKFLNEHLGVTALPDTPYRQCHQLASSLL